ncbi:nuclear transport factor 2 family protein [uncultured Caulobacter sp.]|uniref:nuclear transport factor 2 family protein n=1 Tax=uncultured Caulobacter sp. TaxID=158749 RepID=UPI002639486E|nr:nuclear transport factor 2 family protein [uncultured Caulobacter sp.]
MRTNILTLALPLIFMAASVPVQAQPTTASCSEVATTGPDVEAIRQLELHGGRVNVEGWTIEEAREFFAPEFFAIEPGGGINRLDKVLSNFPNGRNSGFARSFDISGLEIRVYGCDAAIVTGTADVRVLAAPADAPALRIRFLNIWRRDAGHWRLAANQFVRVTAATPPTPER